jgi:hypothetical protein
LAVSSYFLCRNGARRSGRRIGSSNPFAGKFKSRKPCRVGAAFYMPEPDRRCCGAAGA